MVEVAEFESIIDTLECLTEVLKEETAHVRNRELANHQALIDRKAELISKIMHFQSIYSGEDFKGLNLDDSYRARYELMKDNFRNAFQENGMALAAANQIYEMRLKDITQAMYECEAHPIAYSHDHGVLKSGKEVYAEHSGFPLKFSEQF